MRLSITTLHSNVEVEERARLLETATRGEASRREQLLVMRLTAKEQELQEFAAQIAELKAAQAPSTAQLRATLLDPAVNLVIQRLTKECDQQKKVGLKFGYHFKTLRHIIRRRKKPRMSWQPGNSPRTRPRGSG